MPNKSEVERRKEIIRNLKAGAQKKFEDSLPISREDFKKLFDHLDEHLTAIDCDHNLALTISFLQSLNLSTDISDITKWLNENGGYCDCEVLANVEEKFDDNAIL